MSEPDPVVARSTRGAAPAEAAPGPLLTPRVVTVLAAVLFLLLALLLRASLWSYETGDYLNYFKPWFDTYVGQGAVAGLGQAFSNYTPPYLYLLAASSNLGVDPLRAVKLVSLLSDAALVVAALAALRALVPGSHQRRLLGAACVLLGPTVVMNGALWGQVDALYTAPLLAALACAVTRRPWWAMALFGLALAVKLQAIFLAPVFVVLVLRRTLPVRSVLAVPLAYVAAFVPAILAGRPPSIVYDIYSGQAGLYPEMTLNAANFYQFLPNSPTILARPAVLLTAALVVLLVAVVAQQPAPPAPAEVLRLALLFALLVPFFLPHMHERYFFTADVLAVLYATADPRRWWVPVAVVSASLLSYLPFLFGVAAIVPFTVLALLMGAGLVRVLLDVLADLSSAEGLGQHAVPAGAAQSGAESTPAH